MIGRANHLKCADAHYVVLRLIPRLPSGLTSCPCFLPLPPASLPPLFSPARFFPWLRTWPPSVSAAGFAASIVHNLGSRRAPSADPASFPAARRHPSKAPDDRAAASHTAAARAAQPASRLPDCGWPVPDCDSRRNLNQQHRLGRAVQTARAPGETAWSCANPVARRPRPSASAPPALPKAPSAARPEPSCAAGGTRSCAEPARAPCRPCARSNCESIPRARGPCPSASRVFARAGHFAAALGLVRSGALRRLIPAHRFVQQVRIDLRAKHGVGQVHLADVLAFEILDVYNRHCRRVLNLSG